MAKAATRMASILRRALDENDSAALVVFVNNNDVSQRKKTQLQKKQNIPWKQFDRKFPPAKKKIAWVIFDKGSEFFRENIPKKVVNFVSSSGELTCKGSIQRHPSWRNCQVGSVLQHTHDRSVFRWFCWGDIYRQIHKGRDGDATQRADYPAFFGAGKPCYLAAQAMCRPGPGLVSSDPAAARMGWEGAFFQKKNRWKFKMGPWGIFLFWKSNIWKFWL